jgi:hypothetical protein
MESCSPAVFGLLHRTNEHILVSVLMLDILLQWKGYSFQGNKGTFWKIKSCWVVVRNGFNCSFSVYLSHSCVSLFCIYKISVK